MVDYLVCGAGGFIGGHLVKHLSNFGSVRAVDIKPFSEWYQNDTRNVHYIITDLKDSSECSRVCADTVEVYNLAANMGGMGFIESNKSLCMLNVLINTHLLQASLAAGVRKYFFASSACVYNASKQSSYIPIALKEEDAYPAMPEDGYGWEKLFSERMCCHFLEDYGLETRVARFHNVYGPYGTWDGGREKAPAAICRKIIEAIDKKRSYIDIWGSGEQARSFMWIEDCIAGVDLVMRGGYNKPINLGSSELVSINDLVTIVESIAGVSLDRVYNLKAPTGVAGRNSDNTLIQSLYNWEPNTPLQKGLAITFKWIQDSYYKNRALNI